MTQLLPLNTGDKVVIDNNIWTGRKVIANGSVIKPASGGLFSASRTYTLPSGASLVLSSGGFGAPKVTVNGQPVPYGRKMEAVDYLLAAIPLLLPIISLGGALQLGLGVFGFLMNIQTLSMAPERKPVLGKVLALSGVILVVGLAITVFFGILLAAARR